MDGLIGCARPDGKLVWASVPSDRTEPDPRGCVLSLEKLDYWKNNSNAKNGLVLFNKKLKQTNGLKRHMRYGLELKAFVTNAQY